MIWFSFGAGCFSILAMLFLWFYMGLKKCLVDWKKEFGEYNWPLAGLMLLLGLINLPFAALNFWLFFANY